MDFFGIGAALRAMARVYSETARRTGRTNMLLDSVLDGDRIICASAAEQRDLQHRLRERGLQVEVRVIDPRRSPHEMQCMGTAQGRTLFDHGWVEQSYVDALERHASFIGHWQQRLSGFGEAHRQTRRAALEQRMWSPHTPLAEVARLQRELHGDERLPMFNAKDKP
jgi:hypothetical protein